MVQLNPKAGDVIVCVSRTQYCNIRQLARDLRAPRPTCPHKRLLNRQSTNQRHTQ